MKICIIKNCDNPAYVRRLCKSHYGKMKYRGKLDDFPKVKGRSYCIVTKEDPEICSVEWCNNTISAKTRKLCKTCYDVLRTRKELKQLPAHRLSNISLEEKTGICEICGPTRLYGRKSPACINMFQTSKHRITKHLSITEWEVAKNERLIQQGGKCCICNNPLMDGSGGMALDHCHATNTLRGVLCHKCNTGLGKFEDDPERLRIAANYIERYKA